MNKVIIIREEANGCSGCIAEYFSECCDFIDTMEQLGLGRCSDFEQSYVYKRIKEEEQ